MISVIYILFFFCITVCTIFYSIVFIVWQEKLMHFPTWVDLKGEDAVPETVHHVVVNVDPQKDRSWETLRKYVTVSIKKIQTS